MKSATSEDYISTVEWLKTVLQDCELILCEISALKYLELYKNKKTGNITKCYLSYFSIRVLIRNGWVPSH